MNETNEELLREGECSRPNCIEPIGHSGPHSGAVNLDLELAHVAMRAVAQADAVLSLVTVLREAQKAARECCTNEAFAATIQDLKAAKRVNETLNTGFEALRQSLTQMQPDYERCKDDRDAWKLYAEALEVIAQHDYTCRPECTCGLDEALALRPKESLDD